MARGTQLVRARWAHLRDHHVYIEWITAEFSTLRLLHEKGVLSQAEYDSALRDLVETSGARTGDDTTFAVGKFAATLYGFAEFDGIWDSTQSFNDIAGNGLVARSGT